MDIEKLSPKERAIYDKNTAHVEAIFAKIHTTNERMEPEEIALAIIDIYDRELTCMPWRQHFAVNVLEVEKMLVEAIKWGQENPLAFVVTAKKREPKVAGSSLIQPLLEGLQLEMEEVVK